MKHASMKELTGACRFVAFGWTVLEAMEQASLANQQRDLDVVEIFSVSQSLVKAAKARDLSAESYDYMNKHQSDITTEVGFFQAVKLVMRLRLGAIGDRQSVCCSDAVCGWENMADMIESQEDWGAAMPGARLLFLWICLFLTVWEEAFKFWW